MKGRTLADQIEDYIKWLLDVSAGMVEVQRQELAERFTCVPSQVTYVLSTRFTIERGYLVESRRGGGGYVRIVRLPLDSKERLREWLHRAVGDGLSPSSSMDLLEKLREEGFLTPREKLFLEAVLSQTFSLDQTTGDRLRAAMLKAVVLSLLRSDLS
ncbi:MAG TPA: CtsR family transcriptional regulator [Moorella mulderi]|nr:CtsR family transcriptional regulator [Moorella mulderi]